MRPKNLKITALICFLFLLFPSGALSQKARLTDLIITNTRDDLLVYLKVTGAFTPKMEKAVLSGVPTTFSFIIELRQDKKLWFDKTIAYLKVSNSIKYDNLKKEFVVTRSWKSSKPEVTDSFEKAKKLMTEVDSLAVAPLSKLEKGRQYQLVAKAELSKMTLPFKLHYVLFFVSLWDFETDSYAISFIY